MKLTYTMMKFGLIEVWKENVSKHISSNYRSSFTVFSDSLLYTKNHVVAKPAVTPGIHMYNCEV